MLQTGGERMSKGRRFVHCSVVYQCCKCCVTLRHPASLCVTLRVLRHPACTACSPRSPACCVLMSMSYLYSFLLVLDVIMNPCIPRLDPPSLSLSLSISSFPLLISPSLSSSLVDRYLLFASHGITCCVLKLFIYQSRLPTCSPYSSAFIHFPLWLF